MSEKFGYSQKQVWPEDVILRKRFKNQLEKIKIYTHIKVCHVCTTVKYQNSYIIVIIIQYYYYYSH